MNETTYEQTPPVAATKTIRQAWLDVLRDPSQFIRYWNYKGAILSGLLRAPIFLITYLAGRESLKLAVGAATAQFVFRFFFAGLSGALIQSFRRVEPPWKALLSVLLVVPVISHLFEFAIQSGFAYLTETRDHTDDAIVRSVCVSLISALFSLFIMRRNVMIVGEAESKSLFSDVIHLPILAFHFLMFIPIEIAQMLRRREIVPAILSILGFGIFAQTIVWAVTNKFFWSYDGGREIPAAKFWGVDGIVLLLLAVAFSAFFLIPKSEQK